MDAAAAIAAFGKAGHDLPTEAMQWSLDHWDEAAPSFLKVVEDFASEADRSDGARDASFFIMHLAAEKTETRIFPALCRLARDAEALESVLGDGVTSTWAGILINTCGDDLPALKGLIETEAVDEFARSAALEAFAYLAVAGRILRDDAEIYLRQLDKTMQPRSDNYVWVGWTSAISSLGLQTMSELVRGAFEDGRVDEMHMEFDDYLEDLSCASSADGPTAGFEASNIRPLDDAIGELSGWYSFSEDYKRDQAKRASSSRTWDEDDKTYNFDGVPEPRTNPFRGIGRNDPCPCGSGKKFKKCCLSVTLEDAD